MPGVPAVLLDQVAEEPAKARTFTVRRRHVHELIEAAAGERIIESGA